MAILLLREFFYKERRIKLKKKIFAILFVAVILLSLSVPAFAEETPTFQSAYSYVVSGYTMSGSAMDRVKMYPVPNSGLDNGSSTVRLRNGRGVKMCLINQEKIEQYVRANPYGVVNYSVFTDWYYTVAMSNNVVYYSWHRESTISDENGTCPQTVDGSTSWNVGDTDGDGYYLDFEIVDGGTVIWINSSSGNKDCSEKPGRTKVVDFIVQPFTWNDNENPIDTSGEVVKVESVLAGAGQNIDGTPIVRSASATFTAENSRYNMATYYGNNMYLGSSTVHSINHFNGIAFELYTGTEGLSPGQTFMIRVKGINLSGDTYFLGGKNLASYEGIGTFLPDRTYGFRISAKEFINPDLLIPLTHTYVVEVTIANSYSGAGVSFGSDTSLGSGTHNTYHYSYGTSIGSYSFVFVADTASGADQHETIDYEGYDGENYYGGYTPQQIDLSNVTSWFSNNIGQIGAMFSGVSSFAASIFSFLPPEYLTFLLLALVCAVVLAIIRGLRGA